MDTHARSVLATAVVASLLAVPAAQAQTAGAASSVASTSPGELRVQTALKLDARRLLSMKAGEQIAIDFPEIGRHTVTFETITRGLDQRVYWHGRLGQNPRDRVFLKQTATGFVGAVRFAGRQIAFAQRDQQPLARADAAVLAVAGQAYALGAPLGRGEVELRSNLAALAQAQPGSEVALPLPGGVTEVAILTHSRVDEHGFQQIAGVSRMDGVAYPVLLTVSPEAVFGSLITPRGDYQILTRAGRTHILDPRAAGVVAPTGEDQMAAPADVAGTDQANQADQADQAAEPVPLVTQAILRRTGSGASMPSGGGSSLPPTQPVPLPPNTVDTTLNVLVTYSASFSALWGSELAARTRIANLMELANTAHGSSGTGVSLRVVGWRQVQVPDDTPQVQLDRLRLDNGGFQGTASQKAQQGAAMTVFFAPLNEVTVATNTCGIAYVPAAFAGGLTAYRQQVPLLAFAALNDGQWNTQYCESLSLAHELGHLLGAVHDKDNAPFKGVFSYSFGKGVAGVFGTVMSYIQPRVAMFSSPQLSCTSDGQRCGSSTENVVATMLQTKSIAAALGQAGAAPAALETGLSVTGWLLQADGAPFTGAASLRATDARVRCRTGRTGYYSCSVPAGVHTVTLRAQVPGRSVTPGLATFSVNNPSASATSALPVVGRFYVR
ncbi:reprolysin-like metallo-peptidase family M12B [Aquabacterium commune]|uniref:Reprolysin-like metallo-peptidase family M12B n=1 Tax=Aquabacterium commune TaxID=70586 RepID=A0A4R6RAF2_9BURK|nr:zinc-dependent metalloprotease family protein [Aquabacterium commune]TDP82982.1 reprolysin-like metallo-peptidase family M12B [Aquabacterium commune]